VSARISSGGHCRQRVRHGVSTSTHFSAPLIVVNGPIRGRIGLNSGFGVFGPGYGANATIGRALRLLMINVGGARPGKISMSTFGHPGRYTFWIGENEEASPWPPFDASRGLPAGTSALYSHTMLVVGPEHARTFAEGGWSKDDLKRHLHETVRRPYRTLLPDADHGEGTNVRYGRGESVREPGAMISKFPSTEEIHVVVAGGTAGRFSVAIPGWLRTKNGSRPLRARWGKINRLTCSELHVILRAGSGTNGVR
jgi:hypothetical protein